MSDNDFDKAGRACFRLDPPGIVRWLLPKLSKAEDILQVLQLRFGNELPDNIVARIRGTTDLTVLKQWLAAAVQARSLNKFRQALET